MTTLSVRRIGYAVTVQDRGRPGYSDLGLGAAGAADRGSSALANRLVGNSADAAVLEALLGSVSLAADGTVVAVVTGAAPAVEIERADGSVVGAASHTVLTLGAGDVLHLAVPERGLRSYVAVRGGFDVPPVLGSRSWDALAGVGPAPLAIGDVLPVGVLGVDWPVVDAVAPQHPPYGSDDGAVCLDLMPGPRDDWFTEDWRATLTEQPYRTAADSDRVGIRTTAERPLRRRHTAELPSEGVETGSLQVPPDGFPVVFLADHPVTGGYPVIGVLTPESVDRAAQLRPGDTMRFRVVD